MSYRSCWSSIISRIFVYHESSTRWPFTQSGVLSSRRFGVLVKWISAVLSGWKLAPLAVSQPSGSRGTRALCSAMQIPLTSLQVRGWEVVQTAEKRKEPGENDEEAL